LPSPPHRQYRVFLSPAFVSLSVAPQGLPNRRHAAIFCDFCIPPPHKSALPAGGDGSPRLPKADISYAGSGAARSGQRPEPISLAWSEVKNPRRMRSAGSLDSRI
jgi:hypothetical protein